MRIFIILIFFLISFKVNCANVEIIKVKEGNGIEIVNHSKVKVHYIGRLENGTEFDSSYKRKQPFSFQLGVRQVIEGWELGIIGMKPGGKRTIIIPPELGYGDTGAGNLIPPNSKLIFDIEVLEVKSPKYKIIKQKDLKSKQEKGFIVIDIRSKEEIENTGSISGAIQITAFDKNGKFKKKFLETYRSIVTNSDNVILVSNNGEISSILANGMTEYLGAKNMYSLEGGIQEYIKLK